MALNQTGSRSVASDSPARALAAPSPVPRANINELIIKGSPRPRYGGNHRTLVTLARIGFAAAIIGLFIYSKRRSLFPKARARHRSDELIMPGDFKMKESAIHTPTAIGLLAPEAPRRTSIFESLAPAALVTLQFLLLVARKLRGGVTTLWLRVLHQFFPPIRDQEQAEQPKQQAGSVQLTATDEHGSRQIQLALDAAEKPTPLPHHLVESP